MKKEFDVVGIGNVLVDILVKVDDEKIDEFGVKKGVFNPVNEVTIENITKEIAHLNPKITPAGSCPNTIMGIAALGGKCALFGKVGKDNYGIFYESFLKQLKITSNLSVSNEFHTGKCICLITPDAQRTLVADLGAARYLEKNDIIENQIKNTSHLHLTAYELERPNVREAAISGIVAAKESGATVSIDLADPETIKRHRQVIDDIVRNHADILFANESEAKTFTGKENLEEAIDDLSKYADMVILKIGKDGSLIKHLEKTYKIPPYPVKAIDTTGAGDLYASGFLWAYTQNKPIELCGKIGSFVASKIVSQIGAILESNLSEDIKHIQ